MPSPTVIAQYLLPKQGLTRLCGALACRQGGGATQAVIRRFIRQYRVDMSEAAEPDPAAYASFNDFFTRALRPGVRPLADTPLVCPVDGAVSQLGAIRDGRIFQAKGHDYTCTALLGGDEGLAARFKDGQFATIYLSPRDYHRIHMPCTGTLRQMIHVPGELFSVSPATAAAVPGLFARNERVVCVFDASWGPWVLVLVGATIVGSMATVWHGVVNTERPGHIRRWQYPGDGEAITLQKGEEMGRFLLGSTVVMLLPPGAPHLPADWKPGQGVRLGQAMVGV
ncbi:MAG: archaetidylserine decarboxylase [Lautropia sp.]|nr:archaetidylserine decarboxylase [Lautropia sp.]